MEDNKWIFYEEEKRKYLEEHPEATPQEVEEFLKNLAKELNI